MKVLLKNFLQVTSMYAGPGPMIYVSVLLTICSDFSGINREGLFIWFYDRSFRPRVTENSLSLAVGAVLGQRYQAATASGKFQQSWLRPSEHTATSW